MHLSHAKPRSPLAQRSLTRALVYLPFVVLAPVAIYEHSSALLAVVALAAGLVLAFMGRVENIRNRRPQPLQGGQRLLGDGGTFPGSEPQAQQANRQPGVVMDGGSLEHHQH